MTKLWSALKQLGQLAAGNLSDKARSWADKFCTWLWSHSTEKVEQLQDCPGASRTSSEDWGNC